MGYVLNRRPLVAENRDDIMPADLGADIPLSQINQVLPPNGVSLDKLTIDKLYINQNIASSNFESGSTGWIIRGSGDAEFNDGTFRGTLEAGSIHIPDEDTTDDSFHTDSTGNSWWGATQTDWLADNDNAPAWIKKDGSAKFQNVTIAGSLNNTISLPANEALTAGDPAKVIDDLGVSKLEIVKGIYDQTNASGGNTNNIRIIKLADDKIVVAWATSSFAAAICGTISNGVVTYGSSKTLSEATGIAADEIDLVRVNDTTFVTIMTGATNGDDVLGNVLTVSGTTITDANQYVISNLGTTSHKNPIAKLINTNTIAFAWHDGQANAYRTEVWEVSGDTMSSSASAVTASVSGGFDLGMSKIEDDKYILVYDDAGSSDARYRVATFTGSSITWGSEAVFNASLSSRGYVCVYIEDNVIAVLYDEGSATAGKVGVYSESSGTLTELDVANITTISANGDILYSRGHIYHFTGDGTDTEIDVTILDWDSVNNNLYTRDSFSFGTSTSTCAWNHIAEYNEGTLAVLVGANVICGGFDYSLYSGTVSETVAVAETGSIFLPGSTDESQSNLLPNFNVYLDAEANITLEDSTTLLSATFDSFLIGRATDTDTFILTDLI
jgi:hypothetical protein